MSSETLNAESSANPAGFRDLSIDCALPHLGAVHLVDVRETDEYVGPLGHIPGAELVPLATVTAVATGWDKHVPRVLVCRSGGRSGRAAAALTQMGFTNVFNLVGGMLAWEQTDLPRVGPVTAFQELVGEVRLAYAVVRGDAGSLDTAHDLSSAIDAMPAGAWKHRLQERLRALE